jgi:hypothetical protein
MIEYVAPLLAAIGILSISKALRRLVLRSSLVLMIGGVLVSLFLSLSHEGDRVHIGDVVAFIGGIGIIAWMISAFLAWIGRIVLQDWRDTRTLATEQESHLTHGETKPTVPDLKNTKA